MSNWFAWPPWGAQSSPQNVLPPSPPRGRRSRRRSRTRSRPPSQVSRRRSSQLTSAERQARAGEEKKAKKLEDARVAAMSVKDRAEYKQKLKDREDERIKRMKEGFKAEMNRVAQQHKRQVTVLNQAWKRQHDDDTKTQAAERRVAFLEARKPKEADVVAQPEQANREREAYKNHAIALFERIYSDLQNHYLHPTMINTETFDPYKDVLQVPGHLRFQRFRKLISNPEDGRGGLGVDSAAVLMLSGTFQDALGYGENNQGYQAQAGDREFAEVGMWDEFEIMLRLEHASIRAFAIARHIPYMMVYRRTGQGKLGGEHVADESLQLSPSMRDPYEVYLAADGRLLPITFTPLPDDLEPTHRDVTTIPIKSIKESIYNKANFKDYAPPSSWPSTWEYPPIDIQHPCKELGKNYPLCVYCGNRSGAPIGGAVGEALTGICQCKTSTIYNRILVEIRQFPSSTTSKQHDRGIRSLQQLHKGHIIGEIVGEFIPLGAEADFKCPQEFAIDFNGPPTVDANGRVLEYDPNVIVKRRIDTNTTPIATLITGHKGGWTGLISIGRGRTANVEARSEVWAGKLRITVRALRDIKFGEQLLIRQGEVYMEPDGGGSLVAKKKEEDYNERLPMRSLSGFLK